MNLAEIKKRTLPVDQYLDHLEQPYKQTFLTRKQTYQLHTDAVNQLRQFAHDYLVVAFSASWCRDRSQNIPVLALIAETTGLEVHVFGGLVKDPLNPASKWRIPPSPLEAATFDVDKLPLIIVFDIHGKEVGRIVESAKQRPTLEQELFEIIKPK